MMLWNEFTEKKIAETMPTRNIEDIPKSGRIIAFDVGEKTLGVALSSPSRMIGSPHKTIQRTKWGQDKLIIQKLIAAEKATCAVVGLPLSMEGGESAQTQSCLSFADLIEKECGLPVLLWDERLTTKAATDALFEQRQGRQKRASKKDVKQHVDSVAASLILQGVLDRLRFQG